MRITYDPRADAAYIYLRDTMMELETRQVDDDINLDFDARGRLVGVEVLDASKRLALNFLLPECEILGGEENGWHKLREELLRYKKAGAPVKTRDRESKNWVEDVGDNYVVLRRETTGNTVRITRDELENRDVEWHREERRLSIVRALWDIGGYS